VNLDPKTGKLATAWTAVPGAAKYLVTVDLGDGRTRRTLLPGSAHSYAAPRLLSGAKAKATVQAYDSRGVPGKIGTDKVTAPTQTLELLF
jgi:hypothetical protein